jgi:hypothetical protein
MPKKRLIRIAEELGITFEKAIWLAENKLPEDTLSGKQRATWITEEGQIILEEAAYIEEIVPKHYEGRVIKSAANPNYIYAFIKEIDKKVPVIVPRRWRGRLKGKSILIEKIKDVNGESYRYRERHHVESLLGC